MTGFACTRTYGPHRGMHLCVAHYRWEVWSRGRLVAWLAAEARRPALDLWMRRMFGLDW